MPDNNREYAFPPPREDVKCPKCGGHMLKLHCPRCEMKRLSARDYAMHKWIVLAAIAIAAIAIAVFCVISCGALIWELMHP